MKQLVLVLVGLAAATLLVMRIKGGLHSWNHLLQVFLLTGAIGATGGWAADGVARAALYALVTGALGTFSLWLYELPLPKTTRKPRPELTSRRRSILFYVGAGCAFLTLPFALAVVETRGALHDVSLGLMVGDLGIGLLALLLLRRAIRKQKWNGSSTQGMPP